MRRIVLICLVLSGCRDGLVEERRADVEVLCADFCPRRVSCVPDGYAEGDPAECERKCRQDQRPLEEGACGDASLMALECLNAVACADLPAAIAGVAGAGDAPCYAALRGQQDRCDFTPLY